ncbi:hypothetical protein BDN70DRAFT_703115 [Pholiota conissans]|uniref:Uncharacterized protein n=1 Tax=Pholiota conissans TaxID=109636 RepID=A0A9P6D103_9AGAR|nr:hypothetical protein BDN70DRAFT_703115 [Pholiota conissans]
MGRSALRNSWVFPVATVLMYLMSSFHVVLGFYRLLQAYLPSGPIGWKYFFIFENWDSTANSLLVCLHIWLGDVLVIYRCYCVWGNNLIVIVIPLILLAASIGVNGFALAWFENPSKYSSHSEVVSVNAIYPISLAQNIITTGLITIKIWKQHRVSSANRVVDRSSRLTLIKVVRIIIESAMIYTGQMLLLLVLYFYDNTFQYVVQSAIMPSLGIVFLLIALRVHIAKQEDPAMETSIGIPSAWLTNDDNSEAELHEGDGGSPSTASNVSEVKDEGEDATLHELPIVPSPCPPLTS